MLSILKTIFTKQYNKALLYLISLIGLTSASGSDKIIQPEYGVRIVPDYGPPANNFVNFIEYSIIGKVQSKKKAPLKEIRVDAFIGDSQAGATHTDENGSYSVMLKFYGNEGKTVTLRVSDSTNKADGIEYAKKDTTITLSFHSKLLTKIVDFTLDEKREKSRKN